MSTIPLDALYAIYCARSSSLRLVQARSSILNSQSSAPNINIVYPYLIGGSLVFTIMESNDAANMTTTCNFLAGLAFITWDILITMDQEIELIWSRRWNIQSFLYIYIRYTPLIAAISTWPIGSTATAFSHIHFSRAACTVWEAYDLVYAMTLMVAVEYILLLRVCAIYHSHRLIKAAVITLFIIDIICMITGFSLSFPHYEFDTVCTVVNTPLALLVYGGATPVFHTVLFILTSVAFFRAIRAETGHVMAVEILMRDGTWAFVLVEGVMIANAIPFFTDPQLTLFGMFRFALSFVGYRLILNQRAMPSELRNNEESISTQSALVFGH